MRSLMFGFGGLSILLVLAISTGGCTRPAPWAQLDDDDDAGVTDEAGRGVLLSGDAAGVEASTGISPVDGSMAGDVAVGDGGSTTLPPPPLPTPPPPPSPPPSPAANRRLFVTSASYDGDLRSRYPSLPSGAAAADALCSAAAQAAMLGGSWVAWVSTSKQDAIDRVADVGPWFRLDGAKAFNNKVQLTTVPLVAVGVDEFGRELGLLDRIWTATRSGGRAGPSCADFGASDFVVRGIVGQAIAADSGWTDDWEDGCSAHNHLLCLEQ